MPRFHHFNTEFENAWIDLDAITALKRRGTGTLIVTPGYTHEVSMNVVDVLRLIDPPAAPDRFEEHIRRMKQQQPAGLEDRPMTAEPEAGPVPDAVTVARLDELASLLHLVDGHPNLSALAQKAIMLHITDRISVIVKGEA